MSGYLSVTGAGQCVVDTITLSNNPNGFTMTGPAGGVICTGTYQTASPTVTSAMGLLVNNSGGAFTASLLLSRMSTFTAPSVDINLQLNINGAAGSMNARIVHGTSYTAGVYVQDISNTDTVPAGAQFGILESYSGSGLSGQAIFSALLFQMSQAGGVSVPLSAALNGTTTATIATFATRYIAAAGAINMSQSGFPGQVQIQMQTAGVLSGLQANVTQVPGEATNAHPRTIRSYVSPTWYGTNTPVFPTPPSGATDNQVITLASNMTLPGAPVQQDNISHTDAVPAGSFICYEYDGTAGQSGTLGFGCIGSTWTSTQKNVTPMTCAGLPQVQSASSPLTAQIIATYPRSGTGTVENVAACPTGGTFSQATVIMSAAAALGNDGLNPGSFKFMVANSAGTAQSQHQGATISGTAGVPATDISNTDAITANQTFTNTLLNMNGNFSLASQSVLFTTPAPAAKFFDQMALMGVG